MLSGKKVLPSSNWPIFLCQEYKKTMVHLTDEVSYTVMNPPLPRAGPQPGLPRWSPSLVSTATPACSNEVRGKSVACYRGSLCATDCVTWNKFLTVPCFDSTIYNKGLTVRVWKDRLAGLTI